MRPWNLLPAKLPKSESPPLGYFYENVANPLIKDVVRVMRNGLPIDLERVQELEKTLDEVLGKVYRTLKSNSIVNEYQKLRYEGTKKEYILDRKSKCREASYYLKPFKYNDMNHRSYFMAVFCENVPLQPPDELLPTGVPKWSARDVKKLNKPILNRLLAGEVNESNNLYAKEAMERLASDKARIYNEKYLTQIETLDTMEFTDFNPASPDQKHDILTDMLGYSSEKETDAYKKYTRDLDISIKRGYPEPDAPKNRYSWDRDNLERILDLSKSSDEKELIQALIDYSMGAIIKNNFVQAFYRYTIDGRLYGGMHLYGTKTFRLTSSNPNLLNMPSTGSIYAKPVKRCFIAPPGYIVATADFGALENRVIANLSGDENLSNLYLDNLDGHCMNSMFYFKEEIAEYMELSGDLTKDVREYKRLTKEIPALDAIRQKGKGPSFALQYGAYPPKIASALKCTMEEAEEIFNRYHNELYPSVTKFREEYVAPTAKKEKRIHMGLGAYIKTDNPTKDIRTITNACSQFWSSLTLLAINEIHHRIDDELVNPNDIQVTSTIYDSIYFIVKKEPLLIDWLNRNLIEVMTKDFLPQQTVPNLANLDIGTDWSNLIELPNNASLEEIETVLKELT